MTMIYEWVSRQQMALNGWSGINSTNILRHNCALDPLSCGNVHYRPGREWPRNIVCNTAATITYKGSSTPYLREHKQEELCF